MEYDIDRKKELLTGKQKYGSQDNSDFKESEHPRDESGKFGSGSGKKRSPISRLKRSYKPPSKEFSKEKIKEYSERLKTEKDPEIVAALHKAIEAHKKR